MRLLLLVAVAAGLTAGCVERKMIIRSEPEGARLWINRAKKPAGTTPHEETFVHHGTFAIRLEKEGYRPLLAEAPVRTPWYSYPVLDFITEVLLPVTIEDRQEFTFRLELEPEPGTWEERREEVEKRRREVLQRAERMRERVSAGEGAR